MAYFYDLTNARVVQLEQPTYDTWIAAGNPKAQAYEPIPDAPGLNHYWDAAVGQWVEYPVYLPQEISRLQGLIVLERNGLLAQCETLVAQSDLETKLAWANCSSFNRQSPMLLAVAGALGLTDAQLDQLFVDGAQITV